MKNIITLVALVLSFGSLTSAHADSTWLGNIQVMDQFKSSFSKNAWDGHTPVAINLCYYDNFSVSFEYYKQGVTDGGVPADQIWKNISARVDLVKDDGSSLIQTGSAQIAGNDGNNTIYNINLVQIRPVTVSGMDPELQNHGTLKAHLNLILDGVQLSSIPINYTCND